MSDKASVDSAREVLPEAKGPFRTCLSCRAKRPISELMRLTLVQQGDRPKVVLDHGRLLPGRGAWVCGDAPQCLTKATLKGRLARALRVVNPDLSGLGQA
ncbi:MAG: YlxR family protein [Deltaproteobacteria bacterium]|nr:YlxR family protein [Deltaproteobacteria bacterium]